MFPDVKAAEDLTARIRQIVGYLRYSPKETGLVFAALAAAALGWLVRSDQAKQIGEVIFGEHWPKITGLTSVALWGLAGVLLLWACILVWKQLTPPLPSTDAAPRPTAIKGPMSFGPRDAELFRRLGRETEASRLLDWIVDDQIGLIVLKGNSGAGKTSLLRAGLPAVLATHPSPIGYIYWEAVPEQAVTRLLNAVKAGWGTTENGTAPQKLNDLNSSREDGKRRVIILDQFEQLSPSNSTHQPIFRLLRNTVLGMPPYKTTYIVAFREDYASTWLDFQHEQLAGRIPAMMPLRLFSEKQAKEIVAVITEASDFTVDNTLVDDLLASMKNNEGRISPVDIGITLFALNERALTKRIKHLDKADYHIGGGSAGLLAEYISGQLDRYRPDERSKLALAMLELADLDSDKRVAEGLLSDELASKAKLPLVTVQRYLQDLSSPQVRLLEFLSPTGTYRLAHERLIPALRQLAGLVLAEAEQTGREFNRAYNDWLLGGRSRKLLLSGRRLANVAKFRSQLHWDTDRQDKETFLKESLNWRASRRYIASALGAMLLVIGYFGWRQVEIWEYKRDLESWRLPTVLLNSDQLTSLSFNNDRITNLRWFRCSLSGLEMKIPKIDDIEGLRSCKGLVSLSVNISNSQVSSIDALKELRGLTNLTLDLRNSQVSSLDALKELKGLTNLTLDLRNSQVSSLDALKELKDLTHLTLDNLRDSHVSSIDALKELKGLSNLTLDLRDSEVSSIDALKELKGLTNLKLDISGIRSTSGVGSISSIDALKELKRLTNLTLGLGNSQVSSTDLLKELKGLTNLTLDLYDGQVSSLDALKELNGLTNLTLRLSFSQVSSLDALKELKGLTNLTLDLSFSQVSSLDALKELKGLTNLTLDLSNSQVSSIDPLKELKGLTNLTLDLSGSMGSSRVSSLDALKELNGLTNLTLDLSNQVSSLDALKELKDLTNLTLDLSFSQVSSIDPLKELKGLTNLTLRLGNSQVSSLDALKKLKGLTNLTLGLRNSQVSSIDPLKELKGLIDLRLVLGSSRVSSLDALNELKGLTNLTLDLSFSQVSSIDPLKELKGLTSLELLLSNSPDLTFLQSFEHLQTLKITDPMRYPFERLPNSLRSLVLSDF
jgi:hypothetical protein